MNNNLRQNFIYPKIKYETRVFGATHSIGEVINESGDWRDFLPPTEYQKINGIESSGCYIFAQTHTIATILEEQYEIKDSDFAERFNALLSGGTEYGGDPLAGAESFRNDGLIKYTSMPFDESIQSWNDFHSWLGTNKEDCIKEGKEFLTKWKLNYDIVFEIDYPIEIKYRRLEECLKKSPVPMSVYGQVDSEGNYVPKQSWMSDTHMVEAVHVDEGGQIWIWDTYQPFLKKLPAGYNPDFGIMWGITKLEQKKSLWDYIIKVTLWFFREKLIYRDFKKFWINKLKK